MAKKTAKKKTTSGKKPTAKKRPANKVAAKKTNKLGVRNSLVNNINARKKKGIARPKKKSKVSRKSYSKMKKGWK